MAAFRAAAAGGYGIELDVQLSADGVPMVFHDADLARMASRPEKLADLSAAELSQVRLAGGVEAVPALAEVLHTFGAEQRLLIEIKAGKGSAFEACAAAVDAALGDGFPNAAAMSFHPGIPAWFQRMRPGRCRGQVATDASRYPEAYDARELAALMDSLAQRIGEPHFLAFDIRHLPSPLTMAYRHDGLPVLTWTVRSAAEHRRGAEHADNLIFEEEA